MRQSVAHRAHRPADVHHRDQPLQAVMAGPVEEIAQGDYASRFSSEIYREA